MEFLRDSANSRSNFWACFCCSEISSCCSAICLPAFSRSRFNSSTSRRGWVWVDDQAGCGHGTLSGGVITLSSVVSTVDTQYAPCGCSPLGQLSRTSRPSAPGGTVYTHGGIGRTTPVRTPGGASTTSYLYTGADVTVTDAAGKWKTFTRATRWEI